MTAAPSSVLIVASWYPSVDGLAAGRFIADQARAIRDVGDFAPIVVTFDPMALWGSSRLRRRQAAAVRSLVSSGLAAAPSITFDQYSRAPSDRVPVAWLPVPGNARGVGPPDRAVTERAAVLAEAAGTVDEVAGAPVLVHAHTGFPDGAAGAMEAARRAIPLVITEHMSTLATIVADPVRRSRYLGALAAAARVVAVSESLADELRVLSPDVSDRLTVIPNVVDVGAFVGSLPEPRRSDEILFVGNRKPSKGIGELLEAFALAFSRRSSLRLRLIGAAPDSVDEEWRRRAARLGVADAVILDGETGRQGVAAAMARASLFVHPSPRETFGVVAAEALAAGLPVVAVDSGGVRDVLGPDPAAYGALVPSGDPARLAAAILDVLGRLDDFPAAVLRKRANDRFGPESVAGRIGAVYREVLAKGNVGAGDPAGTVAATVGDRVPARSPRLPGGTTESDRPEPRPATDDARLIVVGLDRVRAARVLAAMSTTDRRRVCLVTADSAEPAIPTGTAAVRTTPGFGARYDDLRSVADATRMLPGRDPRRALLRRPSLFLREFRQRMPDRERRLLAAASDAVAAIASPGDLVVVLDGFDALAAEPLVRRGRLTPLPLAGRALAGGELSTQDPRADAGPMGEEGFVGSAAPGSPGLP